jgi:hypothetical protein
MYFYVIMPVGADTQFESKKSIIESVASEKDIKPHFPFDRASYGNFDLDKTLTILRDAEFVLADLTMERPSSYFELGLAQALGKDVYLIAEDGTDVHQANGRSLTRFYRDLPGYKDAVYAIINQAKDHSRFGDLATPTAAEKRRALQ